MRLCAISISFATVQEIVLSLMRDEVECNVSVRNHEGESALDMVDMSSGNSEAITILLQEKLQAMS